MACLSSRVPHGEPVTPKKLRMIEAAENALRDLGFHDVRVRHHELRNVETLNRFSAKAGEPTENASTLQPFNASTSLARIELGPAEIPRFLADGISTRVTEALKGIGYAHVTLDLDGYRRGGANERTGRPD